MVFSRNVQGQTLTFGVSGLLRHSNLVMWDRETESWWQQGELRGIVGAHAGTLLTPLPSLVLTWRDFKAAYPGGTVLSRDSHPRYRDRDIYGVNPYEYYDSASRPFLFSGELDRRLPAMERVVGVAMGGAARAYPYTVLAERRAVNDTVGGTPLVVLYEPSALSTLSAPAIADARAVGTAAVFAPEVGGRRLTFALRGEDIVDQETGSVWNVAGEAVSGPLQGRRLRPLLHHQALWFYWATVHPDTPIYR